MKRIITVFLFLTFILCSCNNGIIKSSVSLNVSSLNTAFSLKSGDTIYSGDMKISDSGEFIFSLTSPEPVQGIVFTVSDNSINTTFGETTVTGTNNAFSELYKAVNLLKDAKEFSRVADGYLFKSEDFTAELDFQGNLKKLNTAKGEFYFK